MSRLGRLARFAICSVSLIGALSGVPQVAAQGLVDAVGIHIGKLEYTGERRSDNGQAIYRAVRLDGQGCLMDTDIQQTRNIDGNWCYIVPYVQARNHGPRNRFTCLVVFWQLVNGQKNEWARVAAPAIPDDNGECLLNILYDRSKPTEPGQYGASFYAEGSYVGDATIEIRSSQGNQAQVASNDQTASSSLPMGPVLTARGLA